MSEMDRTTTDEAGYHWTPTPHLKFVNGRLQQWWEGKKEANWCTQGYWRMAGG